MALKLKRELHGLCAATLHSDCPGRWAESNPGQQSFACRCNCPCHGQASQQNLDKLAALLKQGSDEALATEPEKYAP